jgi:tRNA(adenine34) deaminase
MLNKNIHHFMQEALLMAESAFNSNEVPVGAVVVKDNKIIGRGCNEVIATHSVVAHAEILAINNASKFLENYRLIGCDLYVTLEPCHMCAKAIVDARIENLYFGTYEPKTGAIRSIDQFLDRPDLNHQVQYNGGYMQDNSATLLKKFFRDKRA